MKTRWKYLIGVLAAAALLLSACGDDDDDAGNDPAPTAAAEEDSAAMQNACPADGCLISFANVEAAGDELEVTFDVNFTPDLDSNHIHIYWDNFEPGQVSNDATSRGVVQGEWVPTDSAPTFLTSGATSMMERGKSTQLCVVAGDRDHNVIDEDAEVCTDVSDLL